MLVVIGLSRGDAECAEKNARGSCPSWVRDGRSLINSIARLRNRNDAQDIALVALFSASPRLRVSASLREKKETLNATELPRLPAEARASIPMGILACSWWVVMGFIDSAIP